MLRHLAPVTTPLPLSTLWRALYPPPAAVARFCKAVEQYLGVAHCFAVSSGRTAFYLLLKSLQADTLDPERCEVLLPAYTCPALAKVVLDAGLQPCLIDISPATFAYDAAQLAQQLNRRTLAVLLVHPFGIPQAIVPVQILAAKVGAVVIEDAAQSWGAALDGKLVGTQGNYGLFSLGPGKPLSTGGGGMICVRDATDVGSIAARWQQLPVSPKRASLLAVARVAAFTAAFHPLGWWLATQAGAHRVGEHEASWGYAQTRLTPAQASIGLAQLSHLDDYNQQRRVKAESLIEQLRKFDFVHIPGLDRCVQGSPIYLRLPVLVTSHPLREQLFQALWAAGIGVGRMYGRTLAELFPPLSVGTYPGAQTIAQQLLTLPTHHFVTAQDIDRIVQIFRNGKVK